MRPRRFKRHGIIRRFGQWAVTERGIENVTGPCEYDIDTATLGAPWWSDHMADKNWVIISDFREALTFARQYFKIPVGGDVLW